MITTAIIAEFNPFHNGHAYLFEQAKKITQADRLIVVMSGDFVQRGEPAIMDKYLRSQIALSSGADLVLELPVCYATASAEYFASGAVSLLDQLGVVNYLCFGSESGDLSLLTEAASILCEEPSEYQEALSSYLKEGNSFPVARKLALSSFLPNSDLTSLDEPNNILALEYIKALKKQKSRIQAVTVKRNGQGYHSNCLSPDSVFASATAIRKQLFSDTNLPESDNACALSDSHPLSSVASFLPKEGLQLLKEAYQNRYPVALSDFDEMLRYKLMTEDDFSIYLDVTKDLNDKILKHRGSYQSISSFIALLKSKDITYTRISRVLCHILLNITTEEITAFMEDKVCYYATVLGLNKAASDLTNQIKANSKLMLITSLSKAEASLAGDALTQFAQDRKASLLYESVISSKYNTAMVNERSRKLITV